MNCKTCVNIIWSPNGESKFVKYNSKCIDLYEVTEDGEPIIRKIQSFPDNDIRSVSWHVSIKDSSFKTPGNLLAVGYSNGYIRIISLSVNGINDEEDDYSLAETKFRSNRSPVFLIWNPYVKHFMAQGVDKTKGAWNNEASLIVWEFKGTYASNPSNLIKTPSASNYHETLNQSKMGIDTGNFDISYYGYCKAELVNSLAWTPERRLVCGVSNKYLKLFDLQSVNPQKITSTDAVYGLCCDSSHNKLIASFVDDRLVLWSEKNLDTPASTLMENYPIESIEWSPFGDGYICVVFRDKAFVKIINTNIALKNTVKCQHSLIDQTIETYKTPATVVNAVWNQTRHNCLLIYNSLDQFELHFIHDRIAMCISLDQDIVVHHNNLLKVYYKQLYPENDNANRATSSNLSGISVLKPTNLSCGNLCDDDTYKNNEDMSPEYIDVLLNDEAILFKLRALDMYGQKSISDEYSQMFEKGNRNLYLFWKWIESTYKINSKVYNLKNTNNQYLGIIDCIKEVTDVSISRDMNTGNSRPLFSLRSNLPGSKCEVVRWNQVDDSLSFPKYTHTFRDKIFSVCGWPFNKPLENWKFILDELENQERAASIAMVTLNFEVSLQYFRKLSNPDTPPDKAMEYEILRMCLAGFDTQGGSGAGYQVNPMWLISCQDVLKRLGDNRPYVSLIFRFLIASTTSNAGRQELESILKCDHIQLNDKLAIAALYFDDEALIDYCNSISDKYLLGGNLEGVVMTGLNNRELFCDVLLQNYLDKSSDVQTVAIAVLQAINLTKNTSSQLIQSSTAFCWIETYRCLLDLWKFWYIRCDFDLANNYYQYNTMRNLLLNPQVSSNPSTAPTAPSRPTSTSTNAFDNRISGGFATKSKKTQNKSDICEVYVACYYCGGNIAQPSKYTSLKTARRPMMQNKSNPMPPIAGAGVGASASPGPNSSTLNSGYHGNKAVDMHSGGGKGTICQNCRRPLPRCSVCLLHMDMSGANTNIISDEGIQALYHGRIIPNNLDSILADAGAKFLFNPGLKDEEGVVNRNAKLRILDTLPVNPMHEKQGQTPSTVNPLASWFMWCQTCKHGGHCSHLVDWFLKNPECPVANCRCMCLSLDKLECSSHLQQHQLSHNDDSSDF